MVASSKPPERTCTLPSAAVMPVMLLIATVPVLLALLAYAEAATALPLSVKLALPLTAPAANLISAGVPLTPAVACTALELVVFWLLSSVISATSVMSFKSEEAAGVIVRPAPVALVAVTDRLLLDELEMEVALTVLSFTAIDDAVTAAVAVVTDTSPAT